MSDFGAILKIKNNNKTSFSSEEISLLIPEISNAIENGDFESVDGKIYSIQEDIQDDFILIRLSEYWYGGDDDENQDIFDFAKEHDTEMISLLISVLENNFQSYSFSMIFTEW